MPDYSSRLKRPSPKSISDLCHDSASGLTAAGDVIPGAPGLVMKAIGAVVEVGCDVYDLKHGLEPEADAPAPKCPEVP